MTNPSLVLLQINSGSEENWKELLIGFSEIMVFYCMGTLLKRELYLFIGCLKLKTRRTLEIKLLYKNFLSLSVQNLFYFRHKS